MNTLRNFWNRPHPTTIGFKAGQQQALGFGVIVFLLLALLAPFGLSEVVWQTRIMVSLGFGAITAFIIGFHSWFMAKLWPQAFAEHRWTLGKEFLSSIYHLLIIGLANTLFLWALQLYRSNLSDLIQPIMLGTLYVGIVPLTVITLWEQNQQLRKHLSSAQILNEQLPTEQPQEQEPTLSLLNEAGQEELSLHPHQLLYAKAEGNYVDVFYQNSAGEVTRHILRNRLKALGDTLPSDTFFTCHRSFLVNLSSIKTVHGNARNYELELPDVETRIPVARAREASLKAALAPKTQAAHSPQNPV